MRIATRAGWVALLLASPFLVRSSYEMFVLTPMYGPQMLFFSAAHSFSQPAWLGLVLSAGAYLASLLMGGTIALLSLRRDSTVSHAQAIALRSTTVLALHFIALFSYESWSRWFSAT